MANKLLAIFNTSTVLTNYSDYVDIGPELVYEYVTPAANCRPGKILQPVRIRRPRVVGQAANPSDPTNKTIKSWNGGFSITEVDGNQLGCQLMDVSLSVRWDTTNLLPADLLDTLTGFISSSGNNGGIHAAFANSNDYLALNTADFYQ